MEKRNSLSMNTFSSQPVYIQAILFDFDGLFCDTETSDFAAWVQIYQKYQVTLSLNVYAQCVGSGTGFDPASYLMEIAETSQSYGELWQEHERLHWDLLPNHALPGVVDLAKEAITHGLRLSIVSSSPRLWITRVLKRLNLEGLITHIICRDDVDRVKPFPDLYAMACDQFDLSPKEVIAIEDSPNGAQSALNAGVTCIVIPNDITKTLFFTQHSDIFELNTLEGVTLESISVKIKKPVKNHNLTHIKAGHKYES